MSGRWTLAQIAPRPCFGPGPGVAPEGLDLPLPRELAAKLFIEAQTGAEAWVPLRREVRREWRARVFRRHHSVEIRRPAISRLILIRGLTLHALESLEDCAGAPLLRAMRGASNAPLTMRAVDVALWRARCEAGLGDLTRAGAAARREERRADVLAALTCGDTVAHALFGRGRVVAVEHGEALVEIGGRVVRADPGGLERIAA